MTCWTEDLPELPGIYKLTNKLNGKVYIGKGRDLKHRTSSYKRRNHAARPIEYALNKYGREGFKIEAIEIFPEGTEDRVLFIRETFWIRFFKSANYGFGYNGIEVSFDERGQNLRDRKAEVTKLKKEKKWNFVKPVKENQQTTCFKNWVACKPVNQLDKATGKLIKTWNSAIEAAIAITGRATSRSTICSVAKGKYAHNTAIGFKWEYANIERAPIEIPDEIRKSWSEKRKKENLSEETRYKIGSACRGKKLSKERYDKARLKKKGCRRPTVCKPIYQICPETNRIIQKWPSATDAALELFWDIKMREGIYSCLKGRRKTFAGFIWKRERDMCNIV